MAHLYIFYSLRYKTVLICKAISAIVIWCLIQWTHSFGAYNFAIVAYAFYICGDVAYFAYIFDKVSNEHFLNVSALAHAVKLAGRLIYALLTLTLLSYISLSVHMYLALAIQIATLLVAAVLLNFDRTQPSNSTNQSSRSLQSTTHDMLTQLKCAISNKRVIFWSIWWIFGTGIFHQFMVSNLEFTIRTFHSIQNEVSIHLREEFLLFYIFN